MGSEAVVVARTLGVVTRSQSLRPQSAAEVSHTKEWTAAVLRSFPTSRFYSPGRTLQWSKQLTLTVLLPLHPGRQEIRLPEADVVQPGPQTLHAEVLAPLLGLQLWKQAQVTEIRRHGVRTKGGDASRTPFPGQWAEWKIHRKTAKKAVFKWKKIIIPTIISHGLMLQCFILKWF